MTGRPCRSTVGIANGGRRWPADGRSRWPSSPRRNDCVRGGRSVPVASTATAGGNNGSGGPASKAASKPRPRRTDKLSKDAYRRQKAALDGELTRLGLRKSHLELALGDPAVGANFVELRRVTSELADVDAALVVAEDAWLELEERAP